MLASNTVESAHAFEAIGRCFENGWTDGLPVGPSSARRAVVGGLATLMSTLAMNVSIHVVWRCCAA